MGRNDLRQVLRRCLHAELKFTLNPNVKKSYRDLRVPLATAWRMDCGGGVGGVGTGKWEQYSE